MNSNGGDRITPFNVHDYFKPKGTETAPNPGPDANGLFNHGPANPGAVPLVNPGEEATSDGKNAKT